MTASRFGLALALIISIAASSIPVFAGATLDLSKVPASDWIQIFNKKNLDGWVKKIAGKKVGEDPDSSWHVKDSILWVDYKGYIGDFSNQYGHMAYQKRKFSYYLLRTEYQFFGNQMSGGPDFGLQNNGLMYHSQSMESMDVGQWFPDCIELQLLGEKNNLNKEGTTANVCGIGATFIIDGVRGEYWCGGAKQRTIVGLPWVKVEGLILGDSISRHIVEGDTVLTYTQILDKKNKLPLKDGYIAIQSESAPTKFKSIEVLNLEGCMDPKFTSYRSYFIKSDASQCSSTTLSAPLAVPSTLTLALTSLPGRVRLRLPETENASMHIKVFDLHGKPWLSQESTSGRDVTFGTVGFPPGVYFLQLFLAKSNYSLKFKIFP